MRAVAPAAPLHARAQRRLPGALATFMSTFVAGLVATLNPGMDAGLPLRWLSAFDAWPAAPLCRPPAWRPSLRFAAGAEAAP